MKFQENPTVICCRVSYLVKNYFWKIAIDSYNMYFMCGKKIIASGQFQYVASNATHTKLSCDKDQLFHFRSQIHFDMQIMYPVSRESIHSYLERIGRHPATSLMHYEWSRFHSFELFPTTLSASIFRLTQAGFYYDSSENTIKCFACGVHHDGCLTSASQIELHQEMSPQCPFVLGTDTSNISIQSTESENDTAQSVPNETGIPVEEGQPNRNPSSMEENNISNQPSTETSISINTTNSVINQSDDNVHPRMPAYSSITSRLMTFKNWPKHHSPDSLAEAGFFYTGEGDTVCCFYCGGRLLNWENDDVPWIEHARHFPECKFLHKKFGKTVVAFMHRVRNIEVSMHDLMSRPAAESVRSLEYSNALIQRAYAWLIRSRDPWEITAVNLLDSIFILEDMEQESKAKDEEISRLRTENDRLREKLICKICFDQEASIVFLPCGHMYCTDCSIRLSTRCPICRANIKGIVKTYML